MRRFLIWAFVAAFVAVALAATGYRAYDHLYGRYQPIVVTRGQAEIQRLLDDSAWLSTGDGGQPLYVVGYQDDPATRRFEHEQGDLLRARGVEVRSVAIARPVTGTGAGAGVSEAAVAAEQATVAELWLSRDWSLYQRWMATPSAQWTAAGLPSVDGHPDRAKALEDSRQFSKDLTSLLKATGVRPGHPVLIWRDREGFLKACACSDAKVWAFVREDTVAPETAVSAVTAAEGVEAGSDASGAAEAVAVAPTAPQRDKTPVVAQDRKPVRSSGLPYPTLGPPVVRATPPEAKPEPRPEVRTAERTEHRAARPVAQPRGTEAQVQAPRPNARPAEPRVPRARPAPPRPSKQDDSTFF